MKLKAFIGAICGVLFALGIMVMGHAMLGQANESGLLLQAMTYTLSEADRYHIQALRAELSFEQLWMENVLTQYINSNPQIKSHNDTAKRKDAELNELIEKLWQVSKLPKADWDLDVTTGQFTKKATQ